jgi:cobalt/nickel transport protein
VKLRRLLVPALVVACLGTAFAHYPMLITERATIQLGESVSMKVTNGHPYVDDRYDAPKPLKVGFYKPGSSRFRSLIAAVTSKTDGGRTTWHLEHRPRKAGDFIYSWHCGVTFEKPARNVDDYAKLVVHVSNGQGVQVGWDRTIGDPMEIVPLTRPYSIPVGTAFRGKVLLADRPFNEGNVEAETYASKDPPKEPYLPNFRLNVKTDDQGIFVVTLPRAGWWLIACATDGGPGEQGGQKGIAQRATLWVKVGGTVFDDPPQRD